LFASSPAAAAGSGGDYLPITFNPDVELQTGIDYIWFISSSEFSDGLQRRASLLCAGTDTYPAGRVAWIDNKTDFDILETNNWFVPPRDPTYVQDLAFTMVFTPEPASALLIGTGLFFARPRRRQS
jgi:hypothetical protein